jgi:transcriptional regulator with XRE-family HTH domain
MVSRASIARKVRDLRQARGWTQARLASDLGLSQARLSEIERGGGSFTAEQLLTILRLFNVGVSHFDTAAKAGAARQLQNELARLGGTELRELDILPSEIVDDVNEVVREALIEGDSRHLTALAPVIVRNIDRVKLEKIYGDLHWLGFERRLAWLAENILHALRDDAAKAPRPWKGWIARAGAVLQRFVHFARNSPPSVADAPPDYLDASIRSAKTAADIAARASEISKRWNVVTGLEPTDFRDALEAAYVSR